MENLSLYIILYYSKERIIITFGGIDMDYMTLKEASEKWGVTPRWRTQKAMLKKQPLIHNK